MKKFNLAIVFTSFIVGGGITWGIEHYANHGIIQSEEATCLYEIKTNNNFQFIKPLQFVDALCEKTEFLELKSQLSNTIDSLKETGEIESASLYLREFEEGGWISIHPENHYHPGSLLKLGALFNILKQAESDTSLFSKKLTFQKTKERIPTQTYSSQSLVEGASYSVATLLDYMIAYSDNYATSLLHSIMNYQQYLQTFSQLNLPEPNGSDPNYSVTAANFSNFFKVLYNGTFLSPMMSEKAIEILMKCDFDQGMQAGLPKGTKIAHKFGEWGNREGRHELHEMGIIYLGSKPYLLTIMTSGKEVEKLKPTLSILTHQTHHFLRKLSRQGI